jgi:hypothetical protein
VAPALRDSRRIPKKFDVRARFDHNFIMLARVCSAALNGIEAYPIEVEVNADWGDIKDHPL